MAEPPQKKEKSVSGRYELSEVLIQVAKTKRWFGKGIFHRDASTKKLFL